MEEGGRIMENDYVRRLSILYLTSAIATIVYLALTTLAFVMADKKIPGFVTEAYLGLVGTYAVNNSRFKLKNAFNGLKKRDGEIFTYLFWIYFGLMSIVCFFTGREISMDLFEAFGGITVIFWGTTFFKIHFDKNGKLD